ncbi:MAG: hypothetical protein AB1508_11540 [Pseudomonadota bacterium]
MIQEIQKALSAILGGVPLLRNANGAGRVFELFIMTGIAERLRGKGFEVWLQRSDGTHIRPNDADRRFIQRGGAPSGIQAASKGANNASTIGFRKISSGSTWEIWNGIQFEGRSGAIHELDISIVPQIVGNRLRQNGGYPFGRPRVAIECKDVGKPGSIDDTRAFVARLYDLTVLNWHQNYIRFPPPTQGIYPGTDTLNDSFYIAQRSFWIENRHAFNAIARRTGFTRGSAGLFRYYAIEPHGAVTAGSSQADALLDAVVNWVDSRFP